MYAVLGGKLELMNRSQMRYSTLITLKPKAMKLTQ